MHRSVWCVFAIVLLTQITCVFGAESSSSTVRNVILMVVDGAGYNTWDAASMVQGRWDPASGRSTQVYDGPGWVKYGCSTYPLNRAKVPSGSGCQDPETVYDPVRAWDRDVSYAWLVKTYTDSAAAATALSTGVKTYNNAINWSDGDNPIRPTLSEAAKAAGKSVGVVTTVQWSHATPAGLSNAHNRVRNNYAEIANEMLDGDVLDVIMGAGNPDFDNDGKPLLKRVRDCRFVGGPKTWKAIEAARASPDGTYRSFRPISTKAEFEGLISGPTPSRILGTAQVGTTLQQARRQASGDHAGQDSPLNTSVPSLATMVRGALNVLDDNPQGLFLAIEGGAVDWAAHKKHASRMIEEQIDFVRAVEAVVDWVQAESNWDETLLIITADHETGLLWGPQSDAVPFDPIVDQGPGHLPHMRFNSKNHTNSLVPVYATGAGSENLAMFVAGDDPVRGPYVDNTGVAQVVLHAVADKPLSPPPAQQLDACPAAFPAAGVKPDILLLMPDQMRGDCLSILDHPVVRTPQLDQLAKQGALFRRAYTTVPSCIPARHALLTGLFPQTSGVVGFKAKPITCPTMPQVLRDNGYVTALVGREMHQAAGAKALGYQIEIRGSTYVGGDDYDIALQRAAPETGGIRNLVESLGLTYNLWQAHPWPLDDDLHPTSWIVRQSRKVVADAPADRPLFLTASFYAPHPPLFPPKKYFDAHLQRAQPAPARGDWVDWQALTPRGAEGGHRVSLEGETLRAAQAGYFGLIEHLDDAIGPLVTEFQERSQQAGRPWIVVVTSDHGEMLGDHGYFRKCEPYEGSANIPLLIAGSPALGFRAGLRCLQPVCLEDLLPTLVELAGARRSEVDGVSLIPVLCDRQQPIRTWLHFEHAPCYSRNQAFHALTDGRFKYIWRPTDGSEQLFDLETDPQEERDLSLDESRRDLLETWRSRLAQRLADRPEGFSDGESLTVGRPYRPLQSGVR